LFDHPNDLAAAASTYAKGAKRLRDVGAGTPIETEVNQLATTMESISGRLARGVDDGDTSVVPRAAKRLQEACGIQ